MKQAFVSFVCSTILVMSCLQASNKKEDKTAGKADTVDRVSITRSDTLINSPEATHSKIHNDCMYGDPAGDEIISGLPPSILKWVPEGYSVWDTCYGNLNRDEYEDMIIVLQQYNEDSLATANEDALYLRPLLILTGQSDKTYKLVKRNDSIVYARSSSLWGELYRGISIKNGFFSVEGGIHGGRHWEQTHTFKYNEQDTNWYLYRICYEEWKDNPDNPDEPLSIHKQSCQTTKDFGTIAFDKFNAIRE